MSKKQHPQDYAPSSPLQRIFREFIRRRVAASNRKAVARALGCSPQKLDYLRMATPGRYISGKHLENIAAAEGISLQRLFVELMHIAADIEAGVAMPDDPLIDNKPRSLPSPRH